MGQVLRLWPLLRLRRQREGKCGGGLGPHPLPAQLNAQDDLRHRCRRCRRGVRGAIGARGQVGSHDEADLRLELPQVDRRRAEAVARRRHHVAIKERCVEAGLALGTDCTELVAGVASKLAGHERMLLNREVRLVHLVERRRCRWVFRLCEPLPVAPGMYEAVGPRGCCRRHRCERSRPSCRLEACC